MLTVGSLFSGIGGLDLGLERAGMRVIWQAETDPFACAVLRKRWPLIPNHGDVRTIRAGTVERPDVVCGGFPCQDVSLAGIGRGLEGERSGLWREFARIVGDFRPRFALVENVGALASRGLAAILGDFAALGFDAEWHVVPAAAVNAPHLRDRCFIVAVAADADAGRCEVERQSQHDVEQGASGGFADGLGAGRRRDGPDAADTVRNGRRQTSPVAGFDCEGRRPEITRRDFAAILAEQLAGVGAWEQWGATQSALRRVDDGVPAGLDRGRLATLGNAVVPQVAEIFGRAIVEHAERMRTAA